jgi:hypothetical protein
LAHQAKQGGIERALLDAQCPVRYLLDAQKNPVAVESPKGDSLQNEKIESARKKLGSADDVPS